MKKKNKENEITIFEAGKKTVHCIQCATRFKAYDKPSKCPFCGTTNMILEPNNKEEGKKVRIKLGIIVSRAIEKDLHRRNLVFFKKHCRF